MSTNSRWEWMQNHFTFYFCKKWHNSKVYNIIFAAEITDEGFCSHVSGKGLINTDSSVLVLLYCAEHDCQMDVQRLHRLWMWQRNYGMEGADWEEPRWLSTSYCTANTRLMHIATEISTLFTRISTRAKCAASFSAHRSLVQAALQISWHARANMP